jgi:hypothetical protein
MLRRLFPLVLGLACVGCGLIGDPAHLVDFENATTESVIVYEQGRDVPRFTRDVAPGASVTSSWLWPLDAGDRRVRRVEASTRDGLFMYCRDFTFQELEAVQWRIRITRSGCSTSKQ